MQEQSRARFPSLGAVLSFLFPGLGQLYSGQPTIAAVLAAPVAFVIAGGLIVYLLLADRMQSALFNEQFLTGLLALDLALLMWRLFAIAHVGLARPMAPIGNDGGGPGPVGIATGAGPGAASAALLSGHAAVEPQRLPRRPWEIAVVVLLVILTVGMHVWAGAAWVALQPHYDRSGRLRALVHETYNNRPVCAKVALRAAAPSLGSVPLTEERALEILTEAIVSAYAKQDDKEKGVRLTRKILDA